MTEGRVLQALVRLYAVTANERYLAAAYRTYQSFKNLPSSTVPWTVWPGTTRRRP